MAKIPVVDLGELGLGNVPCAPSEKEWQRVSEEIRQAFTEIGFVYLSNHGIPQTMIDQLFSVSEEFFNLDDEKKRKYTRGVYDIQGYSSPNQERFYDGKAREEIRESYDIITPDGVLPDEEIAALRPAISNVFQECINLTYRMLTALAISLGIDRSYFVKRHARLSSIDNTSSLRILYYPFFNTDGDKGETITRLGAHSDYGTMTLLFQDPSGGLEVKDRSGEWVSAKPIPGTILLNAGDILQFWTSDRFKATKHRVLLKEGGNHVRRSVAFFVHPNPDVVVEPLDGSGKYIRMTAKEHAHKRFAETYGSYS